MYIYTYPSTCTSCRVLQLDKVSTNYINLVLFDSFSGTDQETVEPKNYFGFFRRAVHVQSFQSPCTCTARPVLPSEFTPFDRANHNQELQNAFLDESLAQKEPKLWPWKVGTLFTIFAFCMPI